QVPLAYYSDRVHRVSMAVIGALVWAVFGVTTGIATSVWLLWLMRSGAEVGKSVNTPTHNSLLADYYPIEKRTDVFGFHRIGTAVGAAIGAFGGGLLAYYFSWRTPFVIFAVPSLIFGFLAFKLHEPLRGHWERQAAGANADTVATDEVPPSFAESVRIL